MTRRRFANYAELTSTLAFDLIDMIDAADWDEINVDATYGASNVSCSAYVEILATREIDGDEEVVAEMKLRFSDHRDRYGSDITFRIDDKITVIKDDGEYVATEIESDDYRTILDDAMAHIRAEIAAEAENA